MARSWTFSLPTEIHFGGGSLRRLGSAAAACGTRALLVGYRQAGPLESLYDRVGPLLQRSGVTVVDHFFVDPEPALEVANAGAEQARRGQADLVVALGGGSVIDAAKAIALVAAGHGPIEQYTAGRRSRHTPRALPVVAVPTTFGTGSEVTEVAVFACPSRIRPGVQSKLSISFPSLRPKAAIIDPELAGTMSRELLAASAIDALAHATEACLSRAANPVGTMFATQAVGLLLHGLQSAMEHPSDTAQREHLALAATLAGVAMNSAGVVIGHVLAHALGAVLGIAHARAVAAALPVALRFNAEACHRQLDELAHRCGVVDRAGTGAVEQLIGTVEQLLAATGVAGPVSAAAPIDDTLLDTLADVASESTALGLKLNPVQVGPAELRNLFRQLLTGNNEQPGPRKAAV